MSGRAGIQFPSFGVCDLVYAWGQNGYGQLGDGTSTDHNVPLPVSFLSSGVTTVAAGEGGATGAISAWPSGGSPASQNGEVASRGQFSRENVPDIVSRHE